MQNRFKTSAMIRRMVVIAMFTAMAFVAMLLIHIKVGFLTLDVKDAVITLCGLYFGPLSALLISVLVPVLELSVSSTGYYGLIMNILGSVCFSVTVSLIYKYKKTLWGAVAALVSGAFLMVAVMLLFNLLVTPHYMGVTVETVRGMIPTLLFPFNLLKAIVNVGIVLLLYKPMSRALRRAGFLPRRPASAVADGMPAQAVSKSKKKLTTVLVTVVAVVLIAVSMVLIFTVFDGSFDFGI
ncbi:MAG: ECF transporter S component [Clostridia bacterium]|nr:ECF transporter S component [Clostridia bacterium]